MSRPGRATKSPANPKPSAGPTEPVVQLKPRRGLFFTLLVVFLIWMGFLLGLYFRTVYHKTDVHVEHPSDRALP